MDNKSVRNIKEYYLKNGCTDRYIRLDNTDIKYDIDELIQVKNNKSVSGVFVMMTSPEGCDSKYHYSRKILMNMRWDNSLGFPGGHIDEGEDVLTALRRECKEETGYDLDTTPENCKLLCIHYDMINEFTIITYVVDTDYDTLKAIRKNYITAEYAESEINGMCIMNYVDDSSDKVYTNLMNDNYCATAKLELDVFIKEIYPTLK